jgi:hypothetical protein
MNLFLHLGSDISKDADEPQIEIWYPKEKQKDSGVSFMYNIVLTPRYKQCLLIQSTSHETVEKHDIYKYSFLSYHSQTTTEEIQENARGAAVDILSPTDSTTIMVAP